MPYLLNHNASMKKLLIIFALSTLFSSCDNEDVFSPQESFTRLYNDAGTVADYHPVDIVQTQDGGYLILSAFDEWQVYLMKINSQGRFVWDRLLSDQYVNPVGEFLLIEDSLHFMCMERQTREATIFRVNDFEEDINQFVSYQGLIDPLDVRITSAEELIVLSHQSPANAMGFSLIGNNFSQRWGRLFPTGEDISELVENHLRNRIERLPFFCGSLAGNGGYFFNGITEDNLSLVFTNSISGEFTGAVDGVGQAAAVSGLVPLSGNSFAVAHFNLNNYFVSAEQTINTNATGTINLLEGRRFPDLQTGKRTLMRQIEVDGRRLICVISQTRDLKVRLALYNETGGSLAGAQVLGFGNPLDITSVKPTRDGGLILLGSSNVSGRIKRLYVIKMAKEEILTLLN